MSDRTHANEAIRRIVVCGVSGCGKSTAGQALAAALGWGFLEADLLHPEANIAAMREGRPLDDAMRAPWLAEVRAQMEAAPPGLVVACSALKRAYRDNLAGAGGVAFLELRLTEAQSHARVAGRAGHFMPAVLVASQFAAQEPLSPDEPGMSVDGTWPLARIVAAGTALVGP